MYIHSNKTYWKCDLRQKLQLLSHFIHSLSFHRKPISENIKEHTHLLWLLRIHQVWSPNPSEDLDRLYFEQKIYLLSDFSNQTLSLNKMRILFKTTIKCETNLHIELCQLSPFPWPALHDLNSSFSLQLVWHNLKMAVGCLWHL